MFAVAVAARRGSVLPKHNFSKERYLASHGTRSCTCSGSACLENFVSVSSRPNSGQQFRELRTHAGSASGL